MTQDITIRKKEGDEITFKLRKVESFKKRMLEGWNKFGVVKDMTEKTNEKFGTDEDPNSEKVQRRMMNVISDITKRVFSNSDISEFPILWKDYEEFKENLNGKKEVHFDKLSKENQLFLISVSQSQLFGKTSYPKGVIEGNKLINNGTESSVVVTQEMYDRMIEECKERGYTSSVNKYGKENRVELYSDGTLFELDGLRPVYTIKMIGDKHPDYEKNMEKSIEINNKIQKEVWEFYKDNGRDMFEFMEKCWFSKMEPFHMLFEKGYGEEYESGEREYQNLDGIRTLCEYLGFEILNDDIPFLPIGIPEETNECNCGSGKSFKDCHKDELFKYFPSFEKMYKETNGGGIMFQVLPNRYLEKMMNSLESSSKKEKELVG